MKNFNAIFLFLTFFATCNTNDLEEDIFTKSSIGVSIIDSITINTFSKNLLVLGYYMPEKSYYFIDNTMDSLEVIKYNLEDNNQAVFKIPKVGSNGVGRRLSGAVLNADGTILGITNKCVFSFSNGVSKILYKYNCPLFNEFDRKSYFINNNDSILLVAHDIRDGQESDIRSSDFFKVHEHFTKFNLTQRTVDFTGKIGNSEYLIPNPGYRSNSFYHDIYNDILYMCVSPSKELFMFKMDSAMSFMKNKIIDLPSYNIENVNSDIYIGLLGSSKYTGLKLNNVGDLAITYETGVPPEEINALTFDPFTDGVKLYRKYNKNIIAVINTSNGERFYSELPDNLKSVVGSYENFFIFTSNPLNVEVKSGEMFYIVDINNGSAAN